MKSTVPAKAFVTFWAEYYKAAEPNVFRHIGMGTSIF
jgi:hypothetical protein